MNPPLQRARFFIWRAAPALAAALVVAACGGGPETSAPVPVSSPPLTQPAALASPAVGYLATAGPNVFQASISPQSTSGIVALLSTDVGIANDPSTPLPSDPVTVAFGATASAYATVTAATALRLRPSAARSDTVIELAADRHPDDAIAPQIERLLRGPLRSTAAASTRRTLSLGTSIGTVADLWVDQFPIGETPGTYVPVPATLEYRTPHAYIWVDNTLSFDSASLAQIGADFENAYASDTAHFGTPEYTSAAPGAAEETIPCDTSGNPIPNATPVPVLIPPPNGQHVVFVINETNLGSGVGGYYSAVNHITQAAANCIAGQPKSNEASMIYVGYATGNPLSYELNEDMVRGTAHEFQHLINFVNHGILAAQPQTEDRWINEGLSMLAQDLAVHRLFPSVALDVDDAIAYHVADYFKAPQNFSLTSFSGIEGNSGTFSYNCTGCYGASYLFMRYLNDRFGGDKFLQAMESSGEVSTANLQAVTGEPARALISDFGVALVASNTGATTDPRFVFTGFDPYGTYGDQFGQSIALSGVTAFASQQPATSTTYAPYLGTFTYIAANPARGAGITVTDPSGLLQLAPALIQR
ncbi:MAG TPA: hypothetical protein VME66_00795 [Candidatus Acidoferrales bacterium]|nr:hypothetical protein [Candidatus Acidoferrales bacterium]